MWYRQFLFLTFSVLTLLTGNAQDLKMGKSNVSLTGKSSSDYPQGFFLEGWKAKTITSPSYTDVPQTTDAVTVSLTVDFADTLTKISPYLFGDNANLWTGQMSGNIGLMKHIADRHIGVLRGPAGSISDVFFWNATKAATVLDSVPATLVGSTSTDWPWYGHLPKTWDNSWTMDIDSFYSILGHVDATGIITVNYGYARYGTSKYPVRKAAHLAAEWVRYDKGRSKFWEVGNEVYGSWEAGYQINTSQNRDGQPSVVTGTLYGQHCSVFIDSMKAAAAEIGVDIKIGVVMAEASSTNSVWDKQVATEVGDKADFYVVHSYFTNYNENSTVATILASASKAGSYKDYVWQQAELAGKSDLPVALTEYNIFAIGSKQQVSHINGMHAVLMTGEAMKEGYGLACRWDLANGYNNGDDMGMFSYDEPYVTDYTPHPAFYHLYYLQRLTGDVLLNSSQVGGSGVVIIPTAFSSGQMGAAIVNKTSYDKVVRLNIKNFKFGDRYYTYTLTGTTGENFSRKVYVNGTSTSGVTGGPDDYETITALSGTINDEIRIELPAYSSTFILVEPGTKELTVNDEVTAVNQTREADEIVIAPNPATEEFIISNIPSFVNAIEIRDLSGRTVYRDSAGKFDEDVTIIKNLAPGMYFVTLYGGAKPVTKKLVIR